MTGGHVGTPEKFPAPERTSRGRWSAAQWPAGQALLRHHGGRQQAIWHRERGIARLAAPAAARTEAGRAITDVKQALDGEVRQSFYPRDMAFQSLIRFLIPREDHFFGYLEQQAQVAHEAALALAEFKKPENPAATVRQRVQELEHRGDAIVHQMHDALARTFVTPLDREDLQKLSMELDDILDRTNGAVRVCVLYGVDEPTEPMMNLIDKLVECTEILRNAVPKLRIHKYEELFDIGRRLRRLEKEGDVIYRDAVSRLFHDPSIDAKQLIREREVLEDLENAIDHCERVASTLSNLAVKHG